MKELLLLAVIVCFTPCISSARDWNNDNDHDRKHHRRINATEMTTIQFATVAVLGTAAILVLRRRMAGKAAGF